METIERINLASKLALFSEHWSPKVIAELNGQQVKLVKLAGEFVWHHHEEETGNVVGERTVERLDRI